MADATKTTACLIGHMTYTQALMVCEKNISFISFHSASEKLLDLYATKAYQKDTIREGII